MGGVGDGYHSQALVIMNKHGNFSLVLLCRFVLLAMRKPQLYTSLSNMFAVHDIYRDFLTIWKQLVGRAVNSILAAWLQFIESVGDFLQNFSFTIKY